MNAARSLGPTCRIRRGAHFPRHIQIPVDLEIDVRITGANILSIEVGVGLLAAEAAQVIVAAYQRGLVALLS